MGMLSVKRCLCIAGLLCAAPVAFAQTYTPQAVGTLGGNFSQGNGVNFTGQVAGYSTVAGNKSSGAFLATSPYGASNLVGFGGAGSQATAINTSGAVTGYSVSTGKMPIQAFVYQSSKLTSLGTLGGATSEALGIDANGDVVGFSQVTGLITHAFIYPKGGSMTDIAPKGSPFSQATALNNAGQVVGSGGSSSSLLGAMLWQKNASGTWVGQSVPGLGGLVSYATGINDGGQIVGASLLKNSTTLQGFLSQPNTSGTYVTTTLGTLGGTSSWATGINKSGQVVGASQTSGNTATHAFLYQNGTMTDLNSLIPSSSGWVLEQANGISDSGYITGLGTFAGQSQAFVLVPPAPVTHYAYVVNAGDNTVYSYTLGAGGALTPLGAPAVTPGNAPRSLTLFTPAGTNSTYLYAAGGSGIAMYSVGAGGALTSLGTNNPAAATTLSLDASKRYAYGLSSGSPSILGFTLSASGSLPAPTATSPSGTFFDSLATDPAGEYLYATAAVNTTGTNVPTLLSYSIDASSGALTQLSALSTPSVSEALLVNPNGNNLYVADSNTNALLVYAITGGVPSLIQWLGIEPYSPSNGTMPTMVVDPSGQYLLLTASQEITGGGAVLTYSIGTNGTLTAVGSAAATGNSPTAITFDPSGSYVFVSNTGSLNPGRPVPGTTLSAFSYKQGVLTPLTSPTVTTGSGPIGTVFH